MWRCSRDLTIEEVLRDPIIRAQMSADRVAATDFEALLRSLALRSTPRTPSHLTSDSSPERLTAPSRDGSC